jgi:hypothetical protein
MPMLHIKDASEPSPRSTVGHDLLPAALLVRILYEFYGRASVENNREEMRCIAEIIREISRAASTENGER